MRGKHVFKKGCGIVLSALIVLLGTSSPFRLLNGLPQSIEMTRGQTRALSWGLPLRMEVMQEAQSVLLSGDQTLEEARRGTQISANEAGSAQVSLSLLGWPIKNICLLYTSSARRVARAVQRLAAGPCDAGV